MRNRIFAIVRILWGGAVLLSFFMRGESIADGSYGTGEKLALLTAVAMFVAGIYYFTHDTDQ